MMKDLEQEIRQQKRVKSEFDQIFVDHIANEGNPFHYFYQQTHGSIITTTVPYHIWTQMRLLVQQIIGRNNLLKTVI